MLHWAFLIDFDSKIIFCHAKIACTKLKKFEDIEKYRSWYQYLEIGIETRYRKVSILLNGYRGLVSIPEFGIETRYRKVLIPEKSINTQHYILLTVSSTSSVQLKPFLQTDIKWAPSQACKKMTQFIHKTHSFSTLF